MKLVSPLRPASGFTLLELVVVMSIMMLVIGLGFGSFAMLDDRDPFAEPAQELTQMSRFAINAAVLQHRTLNIVFDKEGFGILGASSPEGSRFTVPKGMKVFILRMGGKNWEKAEGHTWQFGEQGICEPIKIRFESKEGIRDLAFHPLTGMAID